MKKIIIALAAALILAVQAFTPVAAATTADGSACGDTYTVLRGDFLARIARNCGTTLANILALNPQIANPNKIYPGPDRPPVRECADPIMAGLSLLRL